MKSHLTDDFLECFAKLPKRTKRLARENYKLWSNNPYHPSLSFKRIGKNIPLIPFASVWDGVRSVSEMKMRLFGSGSAHILSMKG